MENMLQNPGRSKSTRLVTFGASHAFDHYGQTVESLAHERDCAACHPQPSQGRSAVLLNPART
jgi:hypothetical protein